MIKSSILSNTPLVIKHILSQSITEIDAQKGVDEVIKLIEINIPKNSKFSLLIDVSNYSFTTLEARRIWSVQFKMNKNIQKKAVKVAVVGSTLELNNTEKNWMNSTRLKFFKNENDAENWLFNIN